MGRTTENDVNTNSLVLFQIIAVDPVTGETDATFPSTCRLHHAVTAAHSEDVREVLVWSTWIEDPRTGKITPTGDMLSLRVFRAAA